jgi:N utilization substance protein A
MNEIPLKMIVSAVSNEKGISEDVLFEALNAALVFATKKKYNFQIDVRIEIDKQTGIYKSFRQWIVVEDISDKDDQKYSFNKIPFSKAKVKYKNIQLGDIIEEKIKSISFNRITAQSAKQIIIQKIKDEERKIVIKKFLSKKGKIVTGIVKKIYSFGIIVDIGNNSEALLRNEHMLPKENYRINDRVRALLLDVKPNAKGYQLNLTRTDNSVLSSIFTVEVPEISEGLIEIKAVARDPGIRSKIAVSSIDKRLDPVGACVGLRGSRVQAVSNELNGERIDIILWDENIAQLAMNSMSPAEIISIEIDEESYVMDIAVSKKHLSQAIGKNGQNIRLASQLIGWTLNIVSDNDAKERNSQEKDNVRKLFEETLQLKSNIIDVLIKEGFSSLEELAYIPIQELFDIQDLEKEVVKKIREKSRNALIVQAIEKEENKSKDNNNNLLDIPDMTKTLSDNLKKHGIITRNDLAELDAETLYQLKINEINDYDSCANLIMSARQHWFNKN